MGKDVKVSEDDRVKGLGSAEGFSPWRLKSSTIGDQLRLSNNFKSRSFAVSIKDRSAVMMGGRRPNAAYWYDDDNGKMVSSSYYFESLPAWVENFNNERNTDRYFQQKWEKSLPEDAYKISDRDDAPYESTWRGNTKTFPHAIDGGGSKIGPEFYIQFKGTPFANELMTKFAVGLIENERLGKQEHTDFLGLSYSAPDYCGHIFGPYSQEIQDMIVRLDGQLARLFDEIDSRIGFDKTIVVLTADHGVSPIPGYSQERGFNGLLIVKEDLQEKLEKILKERYGEGDYILWYGNEQIYLNEEQLKKRGADIAEAEDFIGREAAKLPGIATYFTRTKLLKGEAPNTPIGRRIASGFHPKLSGNVWLLVEPFVVVEWRDDIYVTSHKTPYHYDTHVPIVMSGPGIKPGVYNGECSPTDIAPTISTILKIEAPSGSIGRVLTEALK
jgi:predicted AlkP superfamily pyrophosphatase or phosphodiesterase